MRITMLKLGFYHLLQSDITITMNENIHTNNESNHIMNKTWLEWNQFKLQTILLDVYWNMSICVSCSDLSKWIIGTIYIIG